MRRADGHWIYWNVRSDSWDYHPYGPPVVPIPVPASEERSARTPPPPPSGQAPASSASRGYANGNEKPPPPPPPVPSAPAPPWPEASTTPVPPQWPHPGLPGSPPPQQYPPLPYVPIPAKPKPAPAWAAGTPVVFAGWWQRFFAVLVDLLVIWGPTILVLTIIDAAMVPGSLVPLANEIDSTTRAVAMIVAFALCYIVFFSAYFALSNGGESGATLGKRLMRIRVADQYDGTRIGPGRAFLRWILMGTFWVFAYLPGLINLLWPLWDSQRQAWHDKLANSVVVTAPR